MSLNWCTEKYTLPRPALTHRHVLDRDLLLAASPVTFERLRLGCKSSRQLGDGDCGAVLLRHPPRPDEFLHELHSCHVHERHLSRKHYLELILRLNTVDHGSREFQSIPTMTIRTDQLLTMATSKIEISYAERLHEGLKFQKVFLCSSC